MLWLFRSILVLFFFTGIIIYTGFRLFAFGKLFLPSLKRRFFWPIYIGFSYSFIVLAFFRLDRIPLIRLAGMYLLPFFIYLFGFIFLFDLVSLIFLLLQRITRRTGRRPVKIMPAGTGIALALTLFLLLYGSFHAKDIRTVYRTVILPGAALGNQGVKNSSSAPETENFRIVLVSDLHIGPTVGKKWTSRIIGCINKTEPDMVCIAGDIFDNGLDGVKDLKGITAELKRIKAPLGVYACPGNHDTNRRAVSMEDIARFLSEAGIKLLVDEAVSLQPANGKPGVIVAGRRDARPIGMKSGRLSIEELAASLQSSGVIPKPLLILLDHQPVELPQAAQAGFDLVLCGHTHRGQFFPGNLFTSSIFEKAGGTHYGLWQQGNTQAIVSSGAGVWGPPIRIASDSEIVVLDLQL